MVDDIIGSCVPCTTRVSDPPPSEPPLAVTTPPPQIGYTFQSYFQCRR
uniref:Uncharacterized protein n=1 Tax=Podoviridae sp. ctzeq1 TaxID=2826597 RepID=A0A8S5M0M8_9CAUD|nr:MAG TPA: hypothetical protein [Podoviridae sp. ctzeq1]